MHKLLAIVEVDKKNRVKCQDPDCKSYVYRKIHIVIEDNDISVPGSTCYQKKYKDYELISRYTGDESRHLTEDEQRLLNENTKKLVEQFRNEYRKVVTSPEQKKTTEENNEKITRSVKCHYCGVQTLTELSFTPALGFKCDSCKENNVMLPVGRSRRF